MEDRCHRPKPRHRSCQSEWRRGKWSSGDGGLSETPSAWSTLQLPNKPPPPHPQTLQRGSSKHTLFKHTWKRASCSWTARVIGHRSISTGVKTVNGLALADVSVSNHVKEGKHFFFFSFKTWYWTKNSSWWCWSLHRSFKLPTGNTEHRQNTLLSWATYRQT